jgi:acyl-CoA dehydrogenase
LAEEGLLDWTIPARDGGADTQGLAPDDVVSTRALCAVRSELAYQSGLLDVMFTMQGLGSYPLALAGSEDQRQTHLPPVIAAKQVAAFALTEPGAGSDLAGVQTRAESRDGGWRLNGTKTFISNAPQADFFTLLARTSGEPGDKTGLSMFLVPGKARGIEVTAFEVMAPHPIGEVCFHDTTIGETALLGEEGEGLELALATLGRFRTSVAAAACGFARRALDESVRHLSTRRQFGKPLSAFQGLRFDLAEMDTRLRAAELLVAEAAQAVDDGSPSTAPVARAKLFATEAASWICDRAVQHLGGLGVKRGEVVERLFREVRALRIYEGTSEIQKLILAKDLLDTQRSGEGSEA